jgi:hypothetical protein
VAELYERNSKHLSAIPKLDRTMSQPQTSECPIVLYKYKDVAGDGITHVEDMLRNNRVWFASPLEFSDPFDCRCVFAIKSDRDEVVWRKAAFLQQQGATHEGALATAQLEIPRDARELEA